MPKQPTKQPAPRKKSDETNRHAPEREDVEAELPQAPAKEPLAEPVPLDGARAPRPTVEAEVE
ncbi:MAG TPA: hypothetical protein VFV99_22230 [Kofleriaceae bacterium]|nr:hypothetical protein [Kofleriaceae bacterium]